MTIRSLGFAALLMGILFKTLHWPAANVIMMGGTCLTFLAAVLFLTRQQGLMMVAVRKPALLFAAVAVSTSGLLFKIMHWPGANIMLLVGLVSMAVLINLNTVIAQEQRA